MIHQNHDYSHTTYGPSKEEMMASEECILNARLTCESPADYDRASSGVTLIPSMTLPTS